MLAIHSGSQWKLAIWYGSLWKCWPFILVLSENWLRFGVVGWKTSHSVGISVKPDSELFLCCHVSPLQPLGISDLGTAAPATPLHPQKGIEESNVWVLQWEHFTIAYAHPWCKLTGSDAETVIRHAPSQKGSVAEMIVRHVPSLKGSDAEMIVRHVPLLKGSDAETIIRQSCSFAECHSCSLLSSCTSYSVEQRTVAARVITMWNGCLRWTCQDSGWRKVTFGCHLLKLTLFPSFKKLV